MSKRNGNNAAVYNLLEGNPDMTPTALAKQLNIPLGTASSARFQWRKRQGLPTKQVAKKDGHSSVTTITQPYATEQVAEVPASAPSTIEQIPANWTPVQVAVELLSLCMKSIKHSDEQQALISEWRDRARSAEQALAKTQEERDRVLKVHNETIKQIGNGKIPTVEEVVRVLRRESRVTLSRL